jgi:hypothetical protein
MSEFDAIRSILNRPAFQDEDDMEMLASAMSNCALALEMLVDQVESVQADLTLLRYELG